MKIVSGGQTGVDRAALDVAMELGLECGGWCPRGRLAEDGPIDGRYPLKETPSEHYPRRTEWNVRDSDGTLIIARGALHGGSLLTQQLAVKLRKPTYVLDADQQPVDLDKVRGWMKSNRIETLNVAGPRESNGPIYETAKVILRKIFERGCAD